jgi:hypothetical protein
VKRAAPLLAVVALAGCGGGGKEKTAETVHQSVQQATERLHQRVKQETVEKKKPDEADKALLLIEHSDMPEDVKQQLLEAKEMLDKIDNKR